MKTAVVGSINMDMTVTAERIPLKGETLKGEDIRYIPGGKGANQAVAMAKLGADVEMFGCVGGDEAGRSLIKNMEDMGVGTTHIKVAPGVNTGLAVITVASTSSERNTRPGAIMRMGSLPFSMVRTCTGDVWLRSRMFSLM